MLFGLSPQGKEDLLHSMLTQKDRIEINTPPVVFTPPNEDLMHLERLYRQIDKVYAERNKMVALCQRLALLLHTLIPECSIDAGMGRDPQEQEDWQTVAYLDLPAGQCSWHIHDSEKHLFEGIPPYRRDWDGHSTAMKYQRVCEPQLDKIYEQLFPFVLAHHTGLKSLTDEFKTDTIATREEDKEEEEEERDTHVR